MNHVLNYVYINIFSKCKKREVYDNVSQNYIRAVHTQQSLSSVYSSETQLLQLICVNEFFLTWSENVLHDNQS